VCDPLRVLVLLKKRGAAVLGAVVLTSLAAACGGSSVNADPTSGTISLQDQGWFCGEKVDIDRLEVTIRFAGNDAIQLARGCSGRIGEIVVVQYRKDGVKVTGGAHDLVIEGGSIECRGQSPGSHQDGVQAMGGRRITFENLRIDCPGRSSAFIVRHGGTSGKELPTDVVCVRCVLVGGSVPVRINESVRSGVRDSTLCPGRFGVANILDGAVDPVYKHNIVADC
jgi:hypothetical protein